MKIHNITIQGFKSIDEITLANVPPFMVLAGANGSGKSNFVDALNFLGEVIRTNLNNAIEQFQGVDFILNKQKSNNNILFIIVGKMQQHFFYYSIIINVKKDKSIILGEFFKLFTNNEKLEYILEFKNIAFNDDIMDKINGTHKKVSSLKENIDNLNYELTKVDSNNLQEQLNIKSKLLDLHIELSEQEKLFNEQKKIIYSSNDISKLRNIPEAKDVFDFLTNIHVFRIDPVQAKRPSLIGSSSKLASDGSNIADVLEKYEQDENFREELMEWMEMIVPNLTHVKSEKRNIDNSAFLHFQEGKHAFPAGLISDGTIYTLCILTAVLSRSSQYGITIIEEPERGIHPQAIGELIALMREKTQGKHNIILTTHSESVVRNLELEELYLVRKKEGNTLIKSVKNSKVDKNKIPLDTAWLSNMFGGGLPW